MKFPPINLFSIPKQYRDYMDKEYTEKVDFGSEGSKHDQEKEDWSLLPYRSFKSVIKVLSFGAKKYSRGNWQHVKNAEDRYFAAAQRHLAAWHEGELIDSESKLPHLAHAICCLIFLMWFDDRENK